MSSVEPHLSLLDSVVHSMERLCEGELCCLGHKMKVSALCLPYEIYPRADHPLPEYLHVLLQLVILELQLFCVS